MEALPSFETSLTICLSTWRHLPEVSGIHRHRWVNPKTGTLYFRRNSKMFGDAQRTANGSKCDIASTGSFGINRISRNTHRFRNWCLAFDSVTVKSRHKRVHIYFQYPPLYEHDSLRHCKFNLCWIASDFFKSSFYRTIHFKSYSNAKTSDFIHHLMQNTSEC